MKTPLLLFILLTVFTSSSFTQNITTVNSKEYYLTKSKHQKTLAWVMLGDGVALAGLGAALVNTQNISNLGATNQNGASAIIAIVGGASALGSIPVFISASHNKRKAMSLSFEIEKIPTMNFARNSQFQPAATLRISL